MDVLKHYIDKDIAKCCAERIRQCYDSHDRRDICCQCGDEIYCADCPFRCDLCSTENCCQSCNDELWDGTSFYICHSKFEECSVCGYMRKIYSSDAVINLSSVDVKLWHTALSKISTEDQFKYTYCITGEITEEMMSVLNQYSISVQELTFSEN